MKKSQTTVKTLELLAPAGNISQAIHSIDSGCDAIYGGLANWNARMRAGNFSLPEYKQLLEICRKRNVKFYMTLNTLFKDDEGRFRDSVATASAVKRFRKAIDNRAAKNDKSYLGYLGNEVPVKSMFHVLNPRVSLNQKFATSFGEHDFVATFNQNGAATINFDTKIDSHESCFYLKTIFHEKLSNDNDSAWASLTFKEAILDKIDVFDNLGRQFAFALPQQDLIETTPKNIVTNLKDSLPFKLLEIFSNAPEFSSVQINHSVFKDILRKLNDTCNVVPKTLSDYFAVPTAEDYILLNSYSVMQDLKKIGYRNFIFDIMSSEDSDNILSEKFTDDAIIYRLPLLDFADLQKNFLPRLRNKSVMITRPMHLLYKEKYSFKKIFAEYTLNIWNSKALAVLKNGRCRKKHCRQRSSSSTRCKIRRRTFFGFLRENGMSSTELETIRNAMSFCSDNENSTIRTWIYGFANLFNLMHYDTDVVVDRHCLTYSRDQDKFQRSKKFD